MRYVEPIRTEKQINELRERLEVMAERDVEKLAEGEKKYHSSWRKRGGHGAFENLFRKIDRLEAAGECCNNDIFEACETHTASDGTINGKDSLIDDIGDLRRYLYLVEDYVCNLGFEKETLFHGYGLQGSFTKEIKE